MPRLGEDFETWLYKELVARFSKKVVHKTINSGATIGDNDLYLHNIADIDWQIECKTTEKKKNFIIKKEDWDHLVHQANSRLRESLLFSRNAEGDVVVVMDALLLLELLEKLEALLILERLERLSNLLEE